MRGHADDDDWGDAPYDENDGDDYGDSYGDDPEEEPTRDCPSCGFEMLEICIQCPSCGQYISKEDIHHRSQPVWVIATALVCLFAIVFWLFVL